MNTSFILERSKLDQILKKFSLGSISDFAPIAGGLINPAFKLDDKYILRINLLHEGSSKFEREKVASDLIRKFTDVKVPNILALDSSREIIPHQYSILEYCGGNLYDKWKDISESDRLELIQKMAHDLAHIHNIKLETFGDILSPDDEFEDYGEYFLDKIEKTVYLNKEVGIVSPSKIETIEKVLKDSKVSDLEVSPSLVHGDYTPKNILIQDGTTTLIDFEWARGDNPEEEVAKIVFRDKYFDKEEYKEVFLNYYQEIRLLDEGFKARAPFYLLLYFFYVYPGLYRAIPDNTEVLREYREGVDFWLDKVRRAD